MSWQQRALQCLNATFALGIAATGLIAGCAGGAHSKLPDDSIVTTSATPTSEREPPTSEQEPPCDLGADLPTTDVVVLSTVSSAGLYVSRNGITFHVLEVASPDNAVLTLGQHEPLVGDDVQTSLTRVLVSQTSVLIDQSVADLLPEAQTPPLLFLHTGSIGNGQVRPLLIAAAERASDGSVRFLGECASSWQAALDTASAQFATRADLEFLAKVAKWSTAEAGAVVAARNP